MAIDDLPAYPTPMQASYVVQPSSSSQSSGRRAKSGHSNVVYKPHPQQQQHQYPSSTSGFQPGPHPSAPHPQQYAQAPAPQQYYQHTQPPPQQYHQQPQSQYYQNSSAPVHHAPVRQQPVQTPHSQQYYQTPPPQHPQQYQPQEYNQPPPQQHPAPGMRHDSQHTKLSHQTSSQNMQYQPSNSRSKESLSDASSKASSKQKLEYELRSVFDKVDVNKSGKISQAELSNALLNFDHTKFHDSTTLLMINLFSNSNGSIKSLNFDQFVSLWKYLSAYKKLFMQADTNNSGDISFGEFQKVLEQIGYKLNIDLVLHLFAKFSYKGQDYSDASVGKLKFDKFIELLVYLRRLTDIFKKYDKDLSGVATINFSDFLLEVSNLS